jgi:hypothetical protein
MVKLSHAVTLSVLIEGFEMTECANGGGSDHHVRIYAKGVTPECINRGSSSGFAWIPDRSIRE